MTFECKKRLGFSYHNLNKHLRIGSPTLSINRPTLRFNNHEVEGSKFSAKIASPSAYYQIMLDVEAQVTPITSRNEKRIWRVPANNQQPPRMIGWNVVFKLD